MLQTGLVMSLVGSTNSITLVSHSKKDKRVVQLMCTRMRLNRMFWLMVVASCLSGRHVNRGFMTLTYALVYTMCVVMVNFWEEIRR